MTKSDVINFIDTIVHKAALWLLLCYEYSWWVKLEDRLKNYINVISHINQGTVIIVWVTFMIEGEIAICTIFHQHYVIMSVFTE